MLKKIIIILFILFSLASGAFLSYIFGFYGVTTTDSMEPTYPIGSHSFINPFERNIEIGDVVAYKCYTFSKCPKTYTWLISHRLIKVDGNSCYYFYGDNPKYDWSTVPCLMRNDFVLMGVTHKLSF